MTGQFTQESRNTSDVTSRVHRILDLFKEAVRRDICMVACRRQGFNATSAGLA